MTVTGMPASRSGVSKGPPRVSAQTWTSNRSRGRPWASSVNCFSAPQRSSDGMICSTRIMAFSQVANGQKQRGVRNKKTGSARPRLGCRAQPVYR